MADCFCSHTDGFQTRDIWLSSFAFFEQSCFTLAWNPDPTLLCPATSYTRAEPVGRTHVVHLWLLDCWAVHSHSRQLIKLFFYWILIQTTLGTTHAHTSKKFKINQMSRLRVIRGKVTPWNICSINREMTLQLFCQDVVCLHIAVLDWVISIGRILMKCVAHL